MGDKGADLMAGGSDDDTYYVDALGDVVDESLAGSNGTDRVIAKLNFSLADPDQVLGNVEKLYFAGAGEG